ncbi:MAG: GNAT family N-acetyltransferase [Candidatus Berkelbacteria bacterium]
MNTRNIEQSDLSSVRQLLTDWISDDIEIDERVDEISQKPQNFFVAIENESVVGIMGFKPLDEKIIQFASNPNESIEIVSAFVSRAEKRKGTGKSLVAAIESEARRLHFKEILIWSGPRYRETGWAFYDNLSGYERVGFVDNEDFPVWKKEL